MILVLRALTNRAIDRTLSDTCEMGVLWYRMLKSPFDSRTDCSAFSIDTDASPRSMDHRAAITMQNGKSGMRGMGGDIPSTGHSNGTH